MTTPPAPIPEPAVGSVLVVIAHPDDELFVSGTLCLCADRGFDITLACPTRTGKARPPAVGRSTGGGNGNARR